ncbi:MAG: haloacid dehalogenase type II [Pseudomonadota bacterium]
MSQSSIYVFDAYGTLFDVHAAAGAYADQIGSSWTRMSEVWRAKHLEYTWIYAQTGRHTTFWQLTEQSLDTAIASVGGIPDGLKPKLLAAYRELDAYAEVPSVLASLKERGAQLAILTNGDPDMIADATRSAGLDSILDRIITVHEADVFKPDMRVYKLVTNAFGCAPGDVSFQSSNRWDITGAHVFGFRTVWINRSGAPAEYPETPPDRTASDLTALLEN